MSLGFAYQWSFQPVWQAFPLLLSGIKITVALAAVCMALGLLVGGVLATIAEFGPLALRAVVIAYTECFRTIPLLVLLYTIFIALPIVTGISLTPFQSGVLAFTLTLSAYISEAFRAGIGSVGPGQHQAGMALGMTGLQLLRRVIWPQAWRRTLPVLGSIWVGLFKDTALVSLIEVHDLMFQGRVIANETFRYLEVFTIVAVLYYALAYPQARVVDWLFERLRTVE